MALLGDACFCVFKAFRKQNHRAWLWPESRCWQPLDLRTHACYTKLWYLVRFLLVRRISPSIRSSEIHASGVLFVCLSALRCLERTNRAGRLRLSVYREKSVGMRETEVKLNWDIKRIVYSLVFRDVQYGLTWSWFSSSYPLWDDWDVNDNDLFLKATVWSKHICSMNSALCGNCLSCVWVNGQSVGVRDMAEH